MSLDGYEVPVYAKLDGVRTFHPGEVVGQLVALLGALDERKRLAAKKRKARNVHRHVAASRSPREVVEQAPAGVLEAQLIDLVRADGPLVLPGDVPVVIVVQRSPRKRILSKILRTLCLHLNASLIAWTYAGAQREPVVVGQVVIEA